MQEADVARGVQVMLHGTVWQRVVAGTAIVQLPSGSLIAVPVEDLEESAPLGTVKACLSLSLM